MSLLTFVQRHLDPASRLVENPLRVDHGADLHARHQCRARSRRRRGAKRLDRRFDRNLAWDLTDDIVFAMGISNAITLALLFLAGYHWGHASNVVPWKAGLAMVTPGLILVAIAIPLGG